MSSPKSYALPAVVAAIAGAVVSLARRFTALVVELSASVPSTDVLSWYAVGGRTVAFLFVYGLLFGVAYLVASRRRHPDDDSTVALVVGIAAGVGYAAATLATIAFAEISYPGWTFAAATTVGSGIAVGIELGVVAFAGAALARWRTDLD